MTKINSFASPKLLEPTSSTTKNVTSTLSRRIVLESQSDRAVLVLTAAAMAAASGQVTYVVPSDTKIVELRGFIEELYGRNPVALLAFFMKTGDPAEMDQEIRVGHPIAGATAALYHCSHLPAASQAPVAGSLVCVLGAIDATHLELLSQNFERVSVLVENVTEEVAAWLASSPAYSSGLVTLDRAHIPIARQTIAYRCDEIP
eukprot:TRINITY_DN4060_c0_g1_i1.p1 TRINITY_DN4060_c0_g1~~TRINITY_DN4060_c0_g1_i1.p1  ORF type:complete len:203 (+),score=41.21 TRINITY_DN4060_c0_g1_i1:638-1246(+)